MNGAGAVQPIFQVIPIGLIDEPELVIRETMSDEGLESLAMSIKELGLLHPIGVVKTGSRFRIAYGHRRRIAAPRAGLEELPAYVFPEGTTSEEAMKVAENTEREQVNPAAEATYFRYLFEERCGRDIYRLCALVGKSESYIQDRLKLTTGDPDVLDALRRENISVTIAYALNKVKDDGWRRQWLHDAVHMGLSSKHVDTLRRNLERDQAIASAHARGEVAAVPVSTVSPMSDVDRCIFCRSTRDQHHMQYLKVHGDCLSAFERTMDQGDGNGSSGS